MPKSHSSDFSTSQIAKKMGIPSRELFGLLKNSSWIKRGDKGWLLTSKGEFEGGRYVESEKYGQYIVWPEVIVQHPMLQDAPKDLVISASSIGKEFGVSGRYINHVLADLGYLQPGVKGWRLTPQGTPPPAARQYPPQQQNYQPPPPPPVQQPPQPSNPAPYYQDGYAGRQH